jgi:peptidoglycan/LPS O-acetylase OafA/YrhL
VAALVVVLYHLFETRAVDQHTFDAPNLDQLANFALTMLFNGTGAVMLFFVISGYVLGCNVLPDSTLTVLFYAKFAIRRIFRIMPALWLSLVVAVVLLVFYHHQSVTRGALLNAAFLGKDALRFNGPLWSLQIEMAISALYPLLLFANFRFGLFAQLAALAILSLITYSNNDPVAWKNYLFCFQLGIMVPSAGKMLIEALKPQLTFPVFLVALAGIMTPTNLSHLGYLSMTEHALIEGFSGFVILSYILHADCPRLNSLLRSRLARFIGMISYSLYLLHLPISDVLNNLVPRVLNLSIDYQNWGILFRLAMVPVVVTVCAAAAWISYRIIEAPFHELGRRLAGMLNRGAFAPQRTAVLPSIPSTRPELETST